MLTNRKPLKIALANATEMVFDTQYILPYFSASKILFSHEKHFMKNDGWLIYQFLLASGFRKDTFLTQIPRTVKIRKFSSRLGTLSRRKYRQF